MRIVSILNFNNNNTNYNKKPVNTSFRSLMSKPIEDMFFKRAEHSQIIDSKIKKIYNKLQSQLRQTKPEEIEAMIGRLKEFPREEVLELMAKLTKYSNMASISRLWESFRRLNFSGFLAFALENTEGKGYYDSKLEPVKNVEMNSNLVFNYLFQSYRGKMPLFNTNQKAYILDSKSANKLENLEELEKYNMNLVYLKDFEGSYNVFEQHQDFESLVKKNLVELKKLREIYPEETTSQLLDRILNPTLFRAKEYGVVPIIIDNKCESDFGTAQIAQNLSPILPKYQTFEKVFKECIPDFFKTEKEKENFLNIINEKIFAYSSKNFSKELQKLKILIEEKVKRAGKDVNKIYYNIPLLRKSFSLVAYMYQKANNIPDSQFIHAEMNSLNNKSVYKALGDFLPKGSTLVILDDATISGQSLLNSPVSYSSAIKKNFDIIFASVYSTDRAEDLFDSFKDDSVLVNEDEMISTNYQQILFDVNRHAEKGFFRQSLLMLPHIAPDNNLEALSPLIKLFYPPGDFVQESWDF